MIKPNELKINNWVYSNILRMYMQVGALCESTDIDARPIPLTEEILLKCGFKFMGSERHYNGFVISELECGEYYYTAGEGIKLNEKPIKYVHTLQNWYFLYTGGEELEVNL